MDALAIQAALQQIPEGSPLRKMLSGDELVGAIAFLGSVLMGEILDDAEDLAEVEAGNEVSDAI